MNKGCSLELFFINKEFTEKLEAVIILSIGEMAERLKALVLKTSIRL